MVKKIKTERKNERDKETGSKRQKQKGRMRDKETGSKRQRQKQQERQRERVRGTERVVSIDSYKRVQSDSAF